MLFAIVILYVTFVSYPTIPVLFLDGLFSFSTPNHISPVDNKRAFHHFSDLVAKICVSSNVAREKETLLPEAECQLYCA